MSIYYFIGFVVGVAVAVLLITIVRKKIFGSEKAQYDERQLAEQGKAAKYAYYTLMIYIFLYAALESCEIPHFVSPMTGCFVGIVISILIYACICIRNEAYFPINQSAKKWLHFLDAIGILNLVIFVLNVWGNGGMLEEDGSLTTSFINLLCAILMLVISIICRITMKKNSEVEDEEPEA